MSDRRVAGHHGTTHPVAQADLYPSQFSPCSHARVRNVERKPCGDTPVPARRIARRIVEAGDTPDVAPIVYESTGPWHRALEEALADGLPLARVNALRARRCAQAVGQQAKTDAVVRTVKPGVETDCPELVKKPRLD